MPIDLEFTITIGGTDVTQDVASWTLSDIEDGISTIEVVLVSPDNKYAGKFSAKDEISLTWGAGGGQLGPVEFVVRRIRERWDVTGAGVVVTAFDWTEKLAGLSVRGMFPKGMDNKEAYAKAAKALDLVLEDKTKKGKTPKDHKVGGYGESGHNWFNKQEMESNRPQSSGDTPNKPVRDANKKDSKPIAGGARLEHGGRTSGGPIKSLKEELKGTQEKAEETLKQAMLTNQSSKGGSISVRGNLRLVDYATMKAKECVTVLGVGPVASGKWYVQRAIHKWSTEGGYAVDCALLRVDTKQDSREAQAGGTAGGSAGEGGGGAEEKKDTAGAPIIRYAKIFEKNAVYKGPRKIDSPAQATFMVGDGKHVTHFGWVLDIQSAKDSGEKMQMDNKAPNAPKKKVEIVDAYSLYDTPGM